MMWLYQNFLYLGLFSKTAIKFQEFLTWPYFACFRFYFYFNKPMANNLLTLEELRETVFRSFNTSRWSSSGGGGWEWVISTSPGWWTICSRPKGTNSSASPHEIMMVNSFPTSRFANLISCKLLLFIKGKKRKILQSFHHKSIQH